MKKETLLIISSALDSFRCKLANQASKCQINSSIQVTDANAGMYQQVFGVFFHRMSYYITIWIKIPQSDFGLDGKM